MKQLYIVAQNAFTVTAPVGLHAWAVLGPRFRPFASASAVRPLFEVAISTGALSDTDAERVYEPAGNGVGIVTGYASRAVDGTLVMDFQSVGQPVTRLRMTMPEALDRADIVLSPGDDGNDGTFVAHALMIAYMLATSHNGTLLIHASSVRCDGRAYLFQGKSGTGKSTHASLWTRHISGAELLNDDNPVIRFADDGTAMAYGSPWSGKTPCYRNLSAPIGAFVRIVRAMDNTLRALTPLQAYASLTTSVFHMPFVSDALREVRHRTLERLVKTVSCCEMHCRPDADAAHVCHAELATCCKINN